jgi:hypothetical protein
VNGSVNDYLGHQKLELYIYIYILKIMPKVIYTGTVRKYSNFNLIIFVENK